MPHRRIDHQGSRQPLVVPGQAADVAAKLIPRLGRQADALVDQQLKSPNMRMQLVRPMLVLFVDQAFALGHQQLVFGREPALPTEAFDVFADPFVRAFGAGMALIPPLEKLEGDVGNEVHGEGVKEDGTWEV